MSTCEIQGGLLHRYQSEKGHLNKENEYSRPRNKQTTEDVRKSYYGNKYPTNMIGIHKCKQTTGRAPLLTTVAK